MTPQKQSVSWYERQERRALWPPAMVVGDRGSDAIEIDVRLPFCRGVDHWICCFSLYQVHGAQASSPFASSCTVEHTWLLPVVANPKATQSNLGDHKIYAKCSGHFLHHFFFRYSLVLKISLHLMFQTISALTKYIPKRTNIYDTR